jgi:flagellar assembly protein FliH
VARRFEPDEPRDRSQDRSPEERLRDAEQRGYREGRARGEAEAHEELRSTLDELRREMGETISRLHRLEATLQRETEASLVRLALAMASRVVRERVEEGDPVAIRAVVAALSEAEGREPTAIRLHPEDLDVVRAAHKELDEPGALRLIADPAVERGGCLVELDAEELDARVGSQLAALAEHLGTGKDS